MFEVIDYVSNIKSVLSNISYKSFKTQNLPMQNSYCDHRNFDSVNQDLVFLTQKLTSNCSLNYVRLSWLKRSGGGLYEDWVAESFFY